MNSLEIVAVFGALLGVIVVTVALAWWLQRKRARLAPRNRRRFDRRQFFIVMIIMVGCALLMLSQGRFMIAAMYGLAVLALGYPIVSQKMTYGEIDARLNYADDPSRCGRCDYDLTGNVSGVCPECGWNIPEAREYTAPVHWSYWWKTWRIEYIENWWKALAGLVLGALFTAGYTVFAVVWLRQGWFVVVFMGLIVVNYLIQVWRIIAYARRQEGQ